MPQRGSSVLWCSHGPRFLVLYHKRELALPPARALRNGGGEAGAQGADGWTDAALFACCGTAEAKAEGKRRSARAR
jgi:hypothetical protein